MLRPRPAVIQPGNYAPHPWLQPDEVSGHPQHQIAGAAGSLRADRPTAGGGKDPAGAPLVAGPSPGTAAVRLGTPDRFDDGAVGTRGADREVTAAGHAPDHFDLLPG